MGRNNQISPRQQRQQLDFLNRLNQRHLEERSADEELESRIQSFELAFRMQSSMPQLMDLSQETVNTKALYGMDAVVRRVADDRWDAPSPCAGWSARDVVAHQVGVLRGLAETVRTGEMAVPSAPEDRADPVALWSEARDEVIDALDQPGRLQQSGPFWFGEMTIDELIGVVQWDPLTHAWDVAKATGLEAHLDADVAKRSYDTIAPLRELLAKRKLVTPEPVEVAPDADIVSRFLGLVGRDPARS